ncbi:MAG: peptidase, partial [Ramlibacter sp.]|uniref:LysM peptidoglycan-binding domain-containing protein n=1 Tax=Ramlibacter sp. TaxID=1917967 RepID=UPI002602F7E2
MHLRERAMKMTLALLVCGLVAACAAPRRSPAPVEDRGMGRPGTVQALPAAPALVLPGAENAGKPGYYTVKPGDTLIRIALESGQNWRDIARWSELPNANVIEVGQVLRVVPPVAAPGTLVAQPLAPAAG